MIGGLLSCALLAGCQHRSSGRPAAPEYVDVVPVEDRDVALHNPDMGWVLYENYPLDQRPQGSSCLLTLPNETFPAVDEVAIMFAWSDVETRAGNFDFSKVDFAYDHWKARGKKIQLRMSTESLLWWNNLLPPSGTGIPEHVLQELPERQKQQRTLEGISYTVADARNPAYIRRLTRFLEAVAAHFDNRRPVTLIDLRGFGVWGEWHSGFRYDSIDARREALGGVIELWSSAFPRHHLAMSYSYDPDGPPDYYAGPADRFDPQSTGSYDQFVRYSAFDLAMAKPNITLRRDGVGGAVHSNERQLCRLAFETLAKGPMSCEFLGGYSEAKNGGAVWLKFKLDDALSLHPNYINLLGYTAGDALAFMREQPELFNRGLREMGYRLVPARVRYPRRITIGDNLIIEMTWINRGAGRAMVDCVLSAVFVSDADTARREVIDMGSIKSSQWIKGQDYSTRTISRLSNLPPGRYILYFSLRDPRTNQLIGLPLADGIDERSYPIGKIEVTAGG